MIAALLGMTAAACMSGRGQASTSDTTTPEPQQAAVRGLPNVSPPPTVETNPDTGVERLRLTDDQAALFAVGQDTISTDGETRLAEVVDQLAPSGTIEVHGYTDGVGDPQTNLGLSQARADAVKQWLVEHDVDASRLTTQGHGEEGATDNVDDPFSRRVELVYDTERQA